VKLFILDPHTIGREDLVACLEGMPGVEVVDHAGEFVGGVGARVILCPSDCSEESVLAAIRAVAAAADARRQSARLTDREQQVLALIADGHPTREVAERLCYSERTVKNVLHDVVTKLNARSRSQAVAFAVREGLI
jgi:DNA-binding NarL/FixJ family response regulator